MSISTAEFQSLLSQLSHPPEVRLFVKAGNSKRKEIGPCLFCQQWIMVFTLMEEKNLIILEVVPIGFDNEPADYKSLYASKRLPAAFLPDLQLAAASADELETLLSKFRCPDLELPIESDKVAEALRSFIDVYKNVHNFIRNDAEKPLLNALQHLEDYLRTQNTRYLLGANLTYADCVLMPKLQHMRVLLRACREWDIPSQFCCIWRYVKSMYETPIFIASCPADRELLTHYRENKSLNISAESIPNVEDCLHSCPAKLSV